jgi:phosphohistidine phosphatase
MKVLLVRHAIAVDRETPGLSDHLRPLTEEGANRFRKSARGIAAMVTADAVLTSPLLRAKQTAEILTRHWPGITIQEVEALGNGSREEFEATLTRLPRNSTVAAVGHEPHVSEWTSDWLGAQNASAFAFKKGGVALIEFDRFAENGEGKLVFFLAPKALKDLSD